MHDAVITWYASHARELPWRAPDRTAWGVLVSEVMLQQTPVARVLPVWTQWMQRWPSPATLAAAEPADAIRAWGRLGYPRRALRLHAAAVAITEHFGAEVPASYDSLRTLPGVGDYTAAAVATFAFGQRHVVLDTNVRRVLTRAVTGDQFPARAPTAAERSVAAAALPTTDEQAARWSIAVMELGALVCTARAPDCATCPIASTCAWRRAGSPAWTGPARRAQPWHGTDRQARGRILALLRESPAAVPMAALNSVTTVDDEQRARALTSLVTDGLVEIDSDHVRLPGTAPEPRR